MEAKKPDETNNTTDATTQIFPEAIAPKDPKSQFRPETKPSHKAKKQSHAWWKNVIAIILALIVGIAIGAASANVDPKETNEYKTLNSEYSKTQSDLKSTSKQLDKAKPKAEKWDKEQAQNKAKQKAADLQKQQQEQAQQQAQQQAAAQAQAQAQQQAAAQAEAEAQQQAAQSQSRSMGTAHRGSFCSGAGSTAQSDRDSDILTCRVARDGRYRWMN